MYISITRQHMDHTFSQSSADFVTYLEKENEGRTPELQEHFFDQNNDFVTPEKVIKEIDGNTAKLKRKEPKFFAITISPSQKELKAINNDRELLKKYVREVMKDYSAAFYRNQPVPVNSLKYYAKIEYERTYKGFDREVKENRVYKAQIAKLEHDIRKTRRGEIVGNVQNLQRQVDKLKKGIPHRLNGKAIEQGMKKPGLQTHIHIIMSRKDVTNRYSLSPGSKYMESESLLNGKKVKRGFNRDQFFENAEKTFDRLFTYNRNFVETYSARKTYIKNPHAYFARLLKLPINERSAAFQLLGKTGVTVPMLNIPKGKVDLALKTIKQFKKALKVAKNASSIGI